MGRIFDVESFRLNLEFREQTLPRNKLFELWSNVLFAHKWTIVEIQNYKQGCKYHLYSYYNFLSPINGLKW